MPRSALPLALALLAAGCLAADPALPAGGNDLPADLLPPGCDATRAGVGHRAAGLPAPPTPAVPCLLPTGALSGEPTLGVSAAGTVFLFPAMDSAGNVQGDGVGLSRSRDEGANWEVLRPGQAGRGLHLVDLDPYFHLDAETGRIFADNLATLNCSILSFSDDEGDTWTQSLAGCLETDHQTLFTGAPVTSPTVAYPRIVYRCAMNAVAFSGLSTLATCQRSLDGGLTWLAPGGPPFSGIRAGDLGYCDGAVGHGVTDTTGRIYLPKGLCGEPWLAMSDDEGLTWTRVRVSDLGMHREASGTPGHDASVAVGAAGTVHYLWVAEDRLPYLTVSRDGGATWAPPRMVAVPGVREATMPALAVSADGRVGFLYLGSTNSAGAPFPAATCPDLICIGAAQPTGVDEVTWNGYLAVTADPLAADPRFVTVTVNDPADPLVRGHCGAVRCQAVLDFLDVTFGPDGSLWGAFVDTCVETCRTDPSAQNNGAEGVVGRLLLR